MDDAIQIICDLLASDVTSYQIWKATGIATQTLDNYRLYGSKIDNMRIGSAVKLYNYALSLQDNDKKASTPIKE